MTKIRDIVCKSSAMMGIRVRIIIKRVLLLNSFRVNDPKNYAISASFVLFGVFTGYRDGDASRTHLRQ